MKKLLPIIASLFLILSLKANASTDSFLLSSKQVEREAKIIDRIFESQTIWTRESSLAGFTWQ